MGTHFEHRKNLLADDIATYLSSNDQTSPLTSETIKEACATLEFLFSDLFEGDEKWKGQWVDGVIPRVVEVTPGDTVRILGQAILVTAEDEWSLRPVFADLSLTKLSTARLASDETAVPYQRDRPPVLEVPTEWPHVFEFDLRT